VIRKWHGIVFLLWLALGEVSQFPAAAIWELLHSYVSQLGRFKYVWSLSVTVILTVLFSPATFFGFVLVGWQRFRQLEGDAMYATKVGYCSTYIFPSVIN
jgi:hypothetical protein